MRLVPWYLLLCALQAALVAVPTVAHRAARSNLVGLIVPAAAMALGVGTIRLLSAGAGLLTVLAAVGTPVAAAAGGWAFGLGRRGSIALGAAAVAVWAAGWLLPGVAGEACRTALIAAACVSLAALLGPLAEPWALAVGLVALVGLDCALVWGVHQVQPATTALQRATPPSLAFSGIGRRALPALQDVTLGNSTMGWLDLFAPALLGVLLAADRRGRRRAAAAVAAGAAAWGLLLLVTSPIAATVPVLAGLAVTRGVWRRQL